MERVIQSNTVQLKPASSVIHYPSAQIPYSDAKSQINQQAFVITKTFNQGIPQEVAEKQARYANSLNKSANVQYDDPNTQAIRDQTNKSLDIPEEIEMNIELSGIHFMQMHELTKVF